MNQRPAIRDGHSFMSFVSTLGKSAGDLFGMVSSRDPFQRLVNIG